MYAHMYGFFHVFLFLVINALVILLCLLLQLADFREVISRMLGLDLASLALPDYEIITRLEGLIHFNQHHFIPCVCVKDVTRTEDECLDRNIQFLH